MTIIEHPSPNASARVFIPKNYPGARVDTVLLHHTATSDYLLRSGAIRTAEERALSWLCDPDAKVSAHYIVGRQGEIWRLVPESLKAWHAGKGRLPWETCEPYDFNHRSIGIEIVNPGDGVTPFTEAQYRALEWLVPDIARRLEWSRAFCRPTSTLINPGAMLARDAGMFGFILGHRDVAPGRKTDPADNFDWGRIRAALTGGHHEYRRGSAGDA